MTTETTPQININILIHSGYIKDGEVREGNFANQENDPELYLLADCTGEQRTLTLKYIALNGNNIECIIPIDAVKSNLGHGMNLYFIDPDGRRAKIIYYCVERHLYLSRLSFKKRLRYGYENYNTVHKLFAYSQYNQTKLLNTFLQMKRSHQAGRPTKLSKKIAKLSDRKILIEKLISDWHEKKC